MFKGLLSALTFLTIIPLKFQHIYKTTILFFPVIGIFLGGISVGLYLLLNNILPVPVTLFLVIVLNIILTGGLHLDGLADTVDAFSGGKGNREKMLEIMSDSHIGSEGVVALICIFGLKYVLLLNVNVEKIIAILLVVPVIGRWALVVSMFCSNPVRNEGLGKLFIENTNINNLLAVTFITIIITYILFHIQGIILLLIVFVITWLLTKFINKKLNGMTGDTLGAINEITEPSVILISIVLLNNNFF